jgi:hypothetical protein
MYNIMGNETSRKTDVDHLNDFYGKKKIEKNIPKNNVPAHKNDILKMQNVLVTKHGVLEYEKRRFIPNNSSVDNEHYEPESEQITEVEFMICKIGETSDVNAEDKKIKVPPHHAGKDCPPGCFCDKQIFKGQHSGNNFIDSLTRKSRKIHTLVESQKDFVARHKDNNMSDQPIIEYSVEHLKSPENKCPACSSGKLCEIHQGTQKGGKHYSTDDSSDTSSDSSTGSSSSSSNEGVVLSLENIHTPDLIKMQNRVFDDSSESHGTSAESGSESSEGHTEKMNKALKNTKLQKKIFSEESRKILGLDSPDDMGSDSGEYLKKGKKTNPKYA